jgi:NAD(P)-dependent dehydrogenase (short-subunit alcohol dehydrogenase family)
MQVAGKCRDMGGGGWVKTARCDLTDPSSMEDLAVMVSKEHGGLDVLVANAGMLKGGEMLDSDCDDWDLMMKVNLMAPMRLTRLFAPDMIKKGEGTIIFTGSLAGYRPTSMVAYSASKYGIKGWAMSCYESLHQHGISVTVIEPGFVDTPMVKEAPGNHDLFLKPSDIAEAALLPFKFSNAVPTEIVLRLVRPPQ